MAELKIKDLEKSEINEFYKLFSEIIKEDLSLYSQDQKNEFLQKYYSKDRISQYIDSSHSKIVVGIVDEKIISLLFADKTFGGVGFITWFGVDKEYRKKGYARKMMDHYIAFCKDQNAHLVEVYTFTPMIDFYKKLGFEKVGTREKGYFAVENIIMDRNI